MLINNSESLNEEIFALLCQLTSNNIKIHINKLYKQSCFSANPAVTNSWIQIRNHEYNQMFWNLSSHKNLQTNQYKKVLTNLLQTKPAALTILKLTLLKYSTIHIKTFCQPTGCFKKKVWSFFGYFSAPEASSE